MPKNVLSKRLLSSVLYVQPGKPTQNAYIERFNRTARHEWLDLHRFDSLDQARQLATQWTWEYNSVRPNTAIGGVTLYSKDRLLMGGLHNLV